MNCDVLLLGGGFIGAALADRLAVEGRQVHVLTPNAVPKLEGVHYLQGYMDDQELLDELLPRCRAVIHLASSTTPAKSNSLPVCELENLAPSLRMLQKLQDYPETHLVFFSSGGTIYGNPRCLPVPEDAQLAPLSYHGAGKVALEAFLCALRSRGQAVTILRPSNAYGPGQALKNNFGLIRTMLEHVRCGTPLEIWGDGENVRDFIYIDDITEACSRFVALPQDNGTYNLGSGKGYSVNEVRGIVEQITGVKLETVYHQARQIDVRAVVLNISRIEEETSWRPQTSLEEGVRRTWNWLKQA